MSTFKILSIDGGGIRGIIPAYWLSRIESSLQQTSKEYRLLSFFDLLAGTSTGSIIAAGLAIGKSAEDIRRLYEERGCEIFPTSPLCNPLRYRGAFLPKYSGEGLDHVLEEAFGTTKLGDAQKRLLVVAFKGGSRMLKVFDSEKPEDKEFLLRDVLRASCAAPTYLPAKQMKIEGLNQPLLDGGLAANNPAAIALAEAFAANHLPADVLLLSLGTGVSQLPITAKQGAKRGKAQWISSIVDVVFDGSSSANEILVERVLPPTSYFRLQKRDLRPNPALDRADSDHLRALQEEAQQYRDHEKIKFQQLVDALTKKGPPPALNLDGMWESSYTWTEAGVLKHSDWSETFSLKVSDHLVIGETIDSQFPVRIRGRIYGVDFVGHTVSRDKSYKLNGAFVMRMKVDSESELHGHWVGTGDQLFGGEWVLKRQPPK